MIVLASAAPTFGASGQSVEELTAQLWPRERIEAALEAVQRQLASGLITDATYQRRVAMLEARLDGTFEPSALAVTDSPNWIVNGGFEELNLNSRPISSRWIWWMGWMAWLDLPWSGEYENHPEDRPRHVRTGSYSARISSVGDLGRHGFYTPFIPRLPDRDHYEFRVWVKGEGDHRLTISFDDGASGERAVTAEQDWQEVVVTGTVDAGSHGFRVWIVLSGQGTAWLDDAVLMPTAVNGGVGR